MADDFDPLTLLNRTGPQQPEIKCVPMTVTPFLSTVHEVVGCLRDVCAEMVSERKGEVLLFH